ncbi:hypothetical protein M2277_001493 [Paenibacillus sp. LBL]|uniref:hypothetical protein n=1 Tax=Paenibacillus sp. LBL TaxID=2940563 RepID=UPI002474D230|nr:hypothetical protein [Paenibacillus sp. LBL]MDH6670843.1 hypothetical protein [Paenibacillus sp. LBL]
MQFRLIVDAMADKKDTVKGSRCAPAADVLMRRLDDKMKPSQEPGIQIMEDLQDHLHMLRKKI